MLDVSFVRSIFGPVVAKSYIWRSFPCFGPPWPIWINQAQKALQIEAIQSTLRSLDGRFVVKKQIWMLLESCFLAQASETYLDLLDSKSVAGWLNRSHISIPDIQISGAKLIWLLSVFQCQSVPVSASQCQSGPVSVSQCQSVSVSVSQCWSVLVSVSQWQSVSVSASQCQ